MIGCDTAQTGDFVRKMQAECEESFSFYRHFIRIRVVRMRVEPDRYLPKLLTYVTRPNIAMHNLGRLASDNERL